jgi:DNA-binding MarR family transcriptional regulator
MGAENSLTKEQMAAWRSNLLSWKIIERELDRQLQRDFGIPHAYYSILVALDEQTGGASLPLTRLAEELENSQSRMSHAVTKLEELGWVEREKDPSDKRITALRLTEAGRTAHRESSIGHYETVRAVFFAHLDDQDLADLRRIGGKLLGGLSSTG